MSFSCVALFCEDIREETKGTFSLIGILPDNLKVPGFPGGFKSLALYIRISFPPTENPGPIRLDMVDVDNNNIVLTVLENALIDRAIREAIDVGSPLAGLISKVEFGTWPITKPGRVLIRVHHETRTEVCGVMNFMLSDDAAKASAPL